MRRGGLGAEDERSALRRAISAKQQRSELASRHAAPPSNVIATRTACRGSNAGGAIAGVRARPGGRAARSVRARAAGNSRVSSTVTASMPTQHAVAPTARRELALDHRADALPLAVRDAPVETAVGDDLDVARREQHVDQHAVALARVPDTELRKHLERALARRTQSPQAPSARARPRSRRESRRCASSRRLSIAFSIAVSACDGNLRCNADRGSNKCGNTRTLPTSRSAAAAESATAAAEAAAAPAETAGRRTAPAAAARRPAPDVAADAEQREHEHHAADQQRSEQYAARRARR